MKRDVMEQMYRVVYVFTQYTIHFHETYIFFGSQVLGGRNAGITGIWGAGLRQ